MDSKPAEEKPAEEGPFDEFEYKKKMEKQLKLLETQKGYA